MRTKVDASGRVVIPAQIRRQLGISEAGDEVDLIDTPDGVLIRAARAPVPQQDDRGLLVVEVGRPVTTHEVSAAVSADRDRTPG